MQQSQGIFGGLGAGCLGGWVGVVERSFAMLKSLMVSDSGKKRLGLRRVVEVC